MLPSWEGLLKDDFKFKMTLSNWRLFKRKQIEFYKYKILQQKQLLMQDWEQWLNSRKHPGCNSKSYLNMNQQYFAVTISKSHRGIYVQEYTDRTVNNPFVIQLWEGLSWSTMSTFLKQKAILTSLESLMT